MQGTRPPSLYERIGGKAAVTAAVDMFYDRVLEDPLLQPFFDSVDMQKQKGKQRIFLTYAFGGPVNYDGKDMRQAHEALVSKGINDEHFNAVAGHLAVTPAELDVPAELIAEVMAIAASTHDDVLGL